jgi:hypothetical protein
MTSDFGITLVVERRASATGSATSSQPISVLLAAVSRPTPVWQCSTELKSRFELSRNKWLLLRAGALLELAFSLKHADLRIVKITFKTIFLISNLQFRRAEFVYISIF